MPRAATTAFCVVALLGVCALVVVAALERRDLAFTLGVSPALVAAELAPRSEACQLPVDVPVPFDGVRFQVGTYRRTGQPLRVTVDASGRRLADGRLTGGYPDLSQPTVDLTAAVRAGTTVRVCVRNVGDRRIALYGNAELAARDSTAAIDGEPVATDLTLVFTESPRSTLGLVPAMIDRASLFRPGWVGEWTYWLLLALIVLAMPIALGRALSRAFAEDR